MMSVRKPRRLGRAILKKSITQRIPSDFRNLDLIRHFMFGLKFGPK